MGKLKWGVLGFARIAKNDVIPAIIKNPDAELYAIASREMSKLNESKQQFNFQEAYTSYDALLNDHNIDCVYIPLPNSIHHEWAIKAMKKGKHVLCEKPISLNLKECEEMINTSVMTKRILMEAFMYRYTDRIVKLNEVLKRDLIGDIKQINSTFRFFLDRPNTIKVKPELGGGSLYDVGCYAVNFINMINNSKPIAYSALSCNEFGVDVQFTGSIKYENGIVGTINCGFNAYKQMYSEIVGTKGKIEIPDTFAGNEGTITIENSTGRTTIDVGESDRYYLEIKNFTNAVLGKDGTLLSLDESKRNIEMIENLLKCANSKSKAT